MAEIVGLLAAIAGVSTAGLQIAKLLHSSIQFVEGLEDEIQTVAREMETLSSVFEEISTALQFGDNESSSSSSAANFTVSRSAIVTLSGLVQDSQNMYEKIGSAVSYQSKIEMKAKWIFKRTEVEIWSARLSKNISLVTLMLTTLLWAEQRRAQVPISKFSEATVATITDNPSVDQTTRITGDAVLPGATSKIPATIQRQVGETVLCMTNLAKLEEAYDEGAISVQFTTGENLEPRHYVYQPRYGGTMRRENPERKSLWLSERVNIGDEDSLAERFSMMTASYDNNSDLDLDMGNEKDQATELADRLVQDWTTLTKSEDANGWKVVPEAEASEEQLLANDSGSNADTHELKDKTTDLKSLYFSQRALENPENDAASAAVDQTKTRTSEKTMSGVDRYERFEDEKRRLIESCFSRQDADGSRIEAYITHIRITEDALSPCSPPPPSSVTQNKKDRRIIISVGNTARVWLHKARENSNGTFSIEKSWQLDNLSALRNYTNLLPLTPLETKQKEWASDTGFLVTIGKPCYWQARTPKEKEFFLKSLIKIYKKYTKGRIPELSGFTETELAEIIHVPK